MRHLLLGLGLALATPLVLEPTAWAAKEEDKGTPTGEGFDMNDAGITVFLPKGWKHSSWSDWSLKAEAEDKSGFVKIWLTPFQMPMDLANAKGWSEDYKKRLEAEEGKDIEVKSVELKDIGGRKQSWVNIDFNFEIDGRKVPAHTVVTAFESAGQVIHLWTISTQANAEKTQKAFDEILTRMTVAKKPLVLPGTTVLSQAGFAATLPAGWRAPLEAEMPKVIEKSTSVGKPELPPDRCWTAVHPNFSEEADILFACKFGYYPGPIDELSFADVEKELKPKFFGEGEKSANIPAGTPVKAKDRMGFLWTPPNASFRMAALPYDQGLMLLYGLGGKGGAPIEPSIQAAIDATEFSGPGGGAPRIGPDAMISYYVTYKKTSPIVWGPLLGGLAVLAFMVFAFTRKSPQEQGNDYPY